MPLACLFRRDKHSSKPSSPSDLLSTKEKKTLFGLKVVLAQQNPEPIYDLSGCGAADLPDDTYTFCRILGKTSLILKDNCLNSLETGGALQDLTELIILDASCNKIEKLPNTIHYLKSLKILNLSSNKLKSLPDTFSLLTCLEELYLSNNKFLKVPPILCALPKLQVLSIRGNNITTIPKDIISLRNTLQVLDLDYQAIESPNQTVLQDGISGVMKYFCEQEGIEYEGVVSLSDDVDSCTKIQDRASIPSAPLDDIMIEYMRKKQEQLRNQILEEERLRALEKEQLESVLYNSSKSKEELLQELNTSPFEMMDYEAKKQEKVLEHMKLEEHFRFEQNEQLDRYLNNFTNKESLLMDISANEDNLQQEFIAIVAAKEAEKLKLIKDLSESENETNAALQELLVLQQSQKSQDFINQITEQEEEIKKILSGIIEISTEIRRGDILKAMQNSLLEVALAEAEKSKIEERQKTWVSALLKEGQLEEEQLETLLSGRTAVQESFLANVLQEEEYQAEAFKLLLLKMDLKRNSVIRQIALVEFELRRLSALELRKQQFNLQDGSTTMSNQRKTLVGLLQSLFRARDERDKELEQWVSQLSENKVDDLTSEDYWLLQYQRLMIMKPIGISEAEKELDPVVYKIFTLASTLDLLPIFAKRKIDYNTLLNMSEKDFALLDIGSATYHCIQRALHSYLLSTKIGSQEPSAPEDDSAPSAPTLQIDEAMGADLEGRASAPPLEGALFIETECVVCLSSNCRVLFMPCGHVCVCSSCCKPLVTCPLCRSDISSKCYIDVN